LADETDFSFLFESVHRFRCAFEVLIIRAEVAVMEVVYIEILALQIGERLLALAPNVRGLVGMDGVALKVAYL
jgi:hypothetical protein